MKITLTTRTVREIFQDYLDSGDEGVIAFGGNLTVRPKYQREYIYDQKRRDAVIDTVTNKFPINTMYWAYIPSNKEAGLPEYELLDGQQRTLSVLKYVNGDYSVDYRYFHNLTEDEKEAILNYEFQVYVCEGTESQRLAWFKRINVVGLALNDQELLNSTYTGAWLEDAKRHFSKPTAPAKDLADGYINGNPIRQDILAKALKWIAARDGLNVEDYMAANQAKANANELWLYFTNVINWAKLIFPNKRGDMKSVDWGPLYNEYGKNQYDANEMETRIKALILDEEVTNKKGIYPYLFDGQERHLNIRGFTNNQRQLMFERQNGVCPICEETFTLSGMEADHIDPWSSGGKTELDNGQMLCASCNRRKSFL